MLARSFLIKSSSKLLVTRTGIKAWSSSILGRIRPLILELLALEWRKFHTFELEYLWSQLASLDQILCVASLWWGKSCIRFWGRLDQNSGFHGNRKPPLTYDRENDVSTFSRLFLTLSFLYPRHLCRGVYSFHLPFVRSYVRSYFHPVGGITLKFYVQATRVEYISPTTHQKAFIFGP